jgi:hypothetical protein
LTGLLWSGASPFFWYKAAMYGCILKTLARNGFNWLFWLLMAHKKSRSWEKSGFLCLLTVSVAHTY